MPNNNKILKILSILSISVLFNINFISELIFNKPESRFYQYDINFYHYLTLIVLILLLFFFLYTLLNFIKNKYLILLILILVSFNIINFLRINLNISIYFIINNLLIFFVLFLLFIIISIWKTKLINEIILKIYFCFSPFAAIVFFLIINNIFNLENLSDLNIDSDPKNLSDKNKLIFILFDEWDYEITNDLLSKNKLPNLKKILENNKMNKAVQAGPGTYFSVFSMLSGKDVVETKIFDKDLIEFSILEAEKETDDDRLYNPEDHPNYSNFFINKNNLKIKRENNSTFKTIFNNPRLLNYKTNVISSYIPYCKIYERFLDSCTYYTYSSKIPKFDDSFLRLFKDFVMNYNFFPTNHTLRYNNQRKMMLENISKGDFDILYTHLTIPHWPFIYNSTNKKMIYFYDFNKPKNTINQYEDNIILVDNLISEIFRELNKTKYFNQSTVIITSDTHSDLIWGGDISGKNITVPLVVFQNGEYIRIKNNIDNKNFIYSVFDTFLDNNLDINILKKQKTMYMDDYSKKWWIP